MDIKIKKLICLFIGCVFSFLVIGCGNTSENADWDIKVIASEMKDKLDTTTGVTQYDGSVANVAYDNNPKDGNAYVLVNLDIKKKGEGNKTLYWKNVSLIDDKGNKYNRIQDMFLQDHGYNRMPANDLKLDNKGWIAFEVPATLKLDNLKLVYEDDNGKSEYSIK